jgi:hypothetical protein
MTASSMQQIGQQILLEVVRIHPGDDGRARKASTPVLDVSENTAIDAASGMGLHWDSAVGEVAGTRPITRFRRKFES